MEQTLLLIKPDAVERHLIGTILAAYEQNGLQIVRLQLRQVDRPLAERHYAEHAGRPYYEGLIGYITRSPLVVAVLAGDQAIEKVRAINGPTNPAQAPADTIRGRFGRSTRENCVHASDSVASATREIQTWFPDDAYSDIGSLMSVEPG